MHSSGSLIRTAIERIRMLLNEATLDAKYDDTYITRTVLADSLSTLIVKANSGSDNPVCVRYTLTTVVGQEYYVLPSNILQIRRIAKLDSEGRLVWDFRPRGEFNPSGPGWSIEGNSLRMAPFPTQAEDIYVWYIPNGNMNLHYATDGTALTMSAVSTFDLSTGPLIGHLGKVEGEYAGQILRVLEASIHYERIVSSYIPSTRRVVVRNTIPSLFATTPIIYEIVPAGSGPFWSAAASAAAITLGVGRKITANHMGMLLQQHKNDMKGLRDTLFNMQARIPKHMDRNTIDNPNTALAFEKEPW